MEILKTENGIVLKDVEHFDLHHTFLCGQCFRWDEVEENRFIGVASGHLLDISGDDGEFVLKNTNEKEWESFWKHYFAFDRDYGEIKRQLSCDKVLCDAIDYGSGIRILHQDLWETILSFIVSQSNNIPRIKKIIHTFCRCFGHSIVYEGKTYHTFPTLEDLGGITLKDLAPLHAGYRDGYLLETINTFLTGKLTMRALEIAFTSAAKEMLLSLYGVGEKVANCILLFGLSRYESFPIDVWVRRVMEYYYFNGRKTPPAAIASFAKERFGDLGGFAQQYLFYYEREMKHKEIK